MNSFFSICGKSRTAQSALNLDSDEVYQLAADMGGMGFIHSAECEIMRNSALINIHMTDAAAESRDQALLLLILGLRLSEYEARRARDAGSQAPIPAIPDNEYGWEKLYAERMAKAYGRRYGMAVRIARFQNCYGPEGTWTGGREKAPAAIWRKVAEAEDGGDVEIWGDGTAVRSYTYVDDMVDGIFRLMHSDLEGAVNIGCPQYVTVNELAESLPRVAGKKIQFSPCPGPVGVHSRNFSNERIYSIGWKSRFCLKDGLSLTYPWMKEQVKKARSES